MLILATSVCYLFLETQIDGMAFGGQGSFSGVDIIVVSFLVSVLIAIVAVIAGVGGGVIFTPLLLAFTLVLLSFRPPARRAARSTGGAAGEQIVQWGNK